MFSLNGESVTILERSKRFFKSLRFRILLIIIIIGIIPIIVMELVLVYVAENYVVSSRMRNVNAQVTVLNTYFSDAVTAVGEEYSSKGQTDSSGSSSASLQALMTLAIESEFREISDMAAAFMIRVQIVDRDFEIIADSYQLNRGKTCISKDVNLCFNGTNSSYVDKENQCIIITQSITPASSKLTQYVLFGSVSISDIYSAMNSVKLIGAVVIIILAVLVIFSAAFSSYMVFKPFKQINDAIGNIEKGHMSEDIKISGCSEAEDISSSFNIMLGRINDLEQSRQEFVSNVSHELKTPLTSMKVLADSLLMDENVPAEMYREFMGDLSGEIDRENAIISDLLTLVKMDGAGAELNIAATDIGAIVENAMKVVKPLAEAKNVEMVMESHRAVIAEVDEVKFSMAVTNLVENAVKYNNPEGWVHVLLNADQTYFYLTVQDNGLGIPEKAQAKVFDRFYRVDKARDRERGGTGLGLSITKKIVLAHRGEIKLQSAEGQGTTFSMQIPLTYVKN